MSMAEDLAYASLRRLVPYEIIRNLRPDWLKNPDTGMNLEIDLWMPKFHIGFEIQGLHHLMDENQRRKDDYKRETFTRLGYYLYELGMNQVNEYCIRGILKSHNKQHRKNQDKLFINKLSSKNLRAETYTRNALDRFGKTAYRPEIFDRHIQKNEVLNEAKRRIGFPVKFLYENKDLLGRIDRSTIMSKRKVYVRHGDAILSVCTDHIKFI